MEYLAQPKHRKMDMRFGTWNVRSLYRSSSLKPEGKRPLGRPRHRWEGGVRMDLREIGWGVWIGFDQLRTGTGGGLL
jgi:hypothetical protein